MLRIVGARVEPVSGTVTAAPVVTVDPAESGLPSCTTTVGPDGRFTLTLGQGEYYFTGRSPLFHSGAVVCTADGPMDVGGVGSGRPAGIGEPPLTVDCDANPPKHAP